MAASINPISHFTFTTFLYFLLLSPSPTLTLNITALLSTLPDLSHFATLLSAVSADLTDRSSLTLLAVPNKFLSAALNHHHLSPTALADILRYHVLLQFLSPSDLRSIPPSGHLIATLFQTTGRAAASNSGSVNITRDDQNGVVSIRTPSPESPSNATVLSLIKTLPYNITIFAVNSILLPYGYDLMASDTRPPNLGLNITKALIDGHNFNVAASMLSASGVVREFEADEGGAGITVFVPVDDAFANLPPFASFQSLPADKKGVVLKFHVLHSYYPLGSLESVVNPLQPTLATEAMGAGSFTLNISRVNGSLVINSGIVQALVTQTVFDQNPVAIFGVSKVLLPTEIFGKNPIVSAKSGGPAMPPDAAVSPGLNSPPDFRAEMQSEAAVYGSRPFVIVLCCIGLYLVV